MAKKKDFGPVMYGTKQVAAILRIPEWRVKNFTEGGAYGLPPSQKLGTGRGSRRLYNVYDIFRLAVANELVSYGFTPEAVGRGVREIPESMLIFGLGKPLDSRPLLICVWGELGWRVQKAPEVKSLVIKTVEGAAKRRGIFVLDFTSLLQGVIERMRQPVGLVSEGNWKEGGKR